MCSSWFRGSRRENYILCESLPGVWFAGEQPVGLATELRLRFLQTLAETPSVLRGFDISTPRLPEQLWLALVPH